ncbi:MAG: ACT domain-containing protein [Oscillospiraceae bacterium]|nr:ACT domain-containing protein [Oscillospiraceae bacterium]
MFISQISVFAENRNGAMLEVAGALKDANINIRALSIADTADFGIIRLIVDKTEDALKALRAQDMTVSETKVIAVSVADKPGSFKEVLLALFEAEVAIEYAYAFAAPTGLGANVILRCKKQDKAAEQLKKRGLKLLTQEEITG